VLDESRWGRAGASDSIYYKALFRKTANVDVVMVRTIANTGNATFDTMLNAFEGGLSQEESKKKSERTLDGLLATVRKGNSGGGYPPFGYRRVAVNRFTGERRILGPLVDKEDNPILNDKGRIVMEQIRPKEEVVVWEPGDPEEIAIVRRMFDLRIKSGYGPSKIARILNDESISCPKRGRWCNVDQKWSMGTVRSILMNPTYSGIRAYNRQKKKGIGKYSPRYWESDHSKWVLIENAHVAIVTPEQWHAANPNPEKSENSRRAVIRFDVPFPLSGLIKCSHCGFNFVGKTQRIGRSGKRKLRRTYADGAYFSKGPSVCSHMVIGAEDLERAILKELKSMAVESSLPSRILKILETNSNSNGSGMKRQKQEIEASLRITVEKITALLALAESGINLSEITSRLRKLEETKRDLEDRQKQLLTLQTEKKEMLRWADRVADFFQNFEDRFFNISAAEQKVILRKLIERIVIDRENLIANVFLWRLPKGEEKQIDQIIDQERRVFLQGVPPTRFDLVFQA
jgi:DNA invertase Pin-like site-specific DNA recombinase